MRPCFAATVILMLAPAFSTGVSRAEVRPAETGAFVVTQEVVLPGTPEVIYDAATGDISEWWDHSFSETPAQLFIEAKPGGGFFEIFDESGDGARHAVVIAAKRGEYLRFEGPLGLSGNALTLVTSYSFEPVGADSTRFLLEVHGSGEVKAGWPEAVDGVWRHFLFERFQPYIEEGKHEP